MTSSSADSLSVGIFYRDLLRPGGIPRETAQLAREMQKLVNRLVLYCYVGESSREGMHEVEGVPARGFYQPPWRRNRDPLWVPAGMASAIRANEDETSVLMLMGSFIPENVPVARMARDRGTPYVVSVGDAFNPHLFSGLRGFKKRPYERLFERAMVEGALAIRLYSEAQIPHLISRGYDDGGRFFIAKEGVDWDTIEEEGGMTQVSSEKTPDDPLTFGFLGRLSVYQKGLDILLEAWQLYKQSGGLGILTIAGPAHCSDSRILDRLKRRYSVTDVRIVPAIYGQAKYEFLRSLSFLVHPSRHEGIPRVLREALAVGCPIVVTENTNLHDIVERHHAGAVVRTDPQDLARVLISLEHSEQDWPALREGARSAALSLDWGIVANDVVDALASRSSQA